MADPKINRAVTHDILFTIASISKTVAATAMIILYEQGKFALDDDINEPLPFKIRNPHFPNIPITFRMLLSHTSTIQDSNVLYEHYTSKTCLAGFSHPARKLSKNYLSPNGKLYSTENNFLKTGVISTC